MKDLQRVLLKGINGLENIEYFEYENIIVKSIKILKDVMEASVMCACGEIKIVSKKPKECWKTSNFYSHIRKDINKKLESGKEQQKSLPITGF